MLLNQNPERLNAATLNALTTNRSHLLATALNSHAAGAARARVGRRAEPATVTRLERYTYLASVTLGGETTPAVPRPRTPSKTQLHAEPTPT